MELIELFAGIGACSKALERLGIEHHIVDAVEIDKYAIKSFNAIHNTNFDVQDITNWNKNFENIDLIMHGSPCQDFSVAGKQAGGDLGSGTRSSLLYETIRIVGKIRPKYVVWENVKNLLSKKHKHNFDNYIETMNILGYNSYYQILNAKDYGVPQNRERVYTISIRKDIDNGDFKFPEKEELKLRLKDILEKEVDEKYYLKNYQVENFIKNNNGNCNPSGRGMNGKVYQGIIAPTITTNKGEGLKIAVDRIGGIFDTDKSKHQAGSIYNKNGLSPSLDTMQGGYRQPMVLTYVNNKYNNFIKNNGYVPEMFNPYNETEIKNIAPAQTTCCNSTTSSATVLINNNERIRKLTPLECWRLMSFDDEDFYKAQSTGNSNSQLYKQARKLNCSKGFRKNIFKFI